MSSAKLEIFHDDLVKILNESYPDYKIGNYLNGIASISWLSVSDYYTHLKIAEVIAVESFGPGDIPRNSLLVIDYVVSDSRRYDDVIDALYYMKSILKIASDRKKAQAADLAIEATDLNKNEKQGEEENQIHLESLRADEIKLGTIDPNKLYLVGSRHCCKTALYQYLLKSLFCLSIKDVIFNDPATVVFWGDGSKTIVQCQNGEPFDPEKGLAMAISKKVYGNRYNYYEIFKKWVGKYKKKEFRKALDKAKEVADKNPREGTNFNDYLNEQLKDPEFKKQYENTEIIRPYCDTSKENDNEQ